MSMQPIKRGLAALVLMGLALPALAQTTVSDAWVRASVPHQQSTGAFMVLTASSDSKLVGVASPVAKTVQVHEMTMNGDVMGMREVKAVELPAGKAVTLDPNGLHVMLMGLHNQVKEGDKVPLTLTIEDAKGAKETLEVQAQVRALNADAGGGHDHMHMNH
ncbi:copper chaperone PCu(A)C [Pseudomonas putida]|jgi:copper(I)-binding protein|uniref:Copper chaperone PCu(A)C n=1 Tax=Pseudomonas monteilii TaxID=76759 RepID=A0A2N1IMT2_9PSED|nr:MULTISPECIES: copper chaperone PCu(A)C [Pseudomonas]EKT4454952.1 copper chaperone PCu(A)C [Pseudomonas putida]EKT4469966.1 copper chaperone PCu(A)C [Pseudomonas putida]EKT4492653.1 copper chaperone PCu(A)C [Pseudomonas putida]EKT4512272.1 copper chaperone PCu(A)C [Pseudomonas putida]EKT4529241.1 copper chaperone PCu(A)C [Pseudomonas putida]